MSRRFDIEEIRKSFTPMNPPPPPTPPNIRYVIEGGALLDFTGSISLLLIPLVLCVAAGYAIGVDS